MVDGARAVHTVQEKHVRKSGEGNSMPEMGHLSRLLIDAEAENTMMSGSEYLITQVLGCFIFKCGNSIYSKEQYWQYSTHLQHVLYSHI